MPAAGSSSEHHGAYGRRQPGTTAPRQKRTLPSGLRSVSDGMASATGRNGPTCGCLDGLLGVSARRRLARLVSRGPVARFEDDYGRLGRSQTAMRVELWIDRDPALPQPITLRLSGRACAHRARMLVGQSNNGVGVRLEVEPPRGMTLVPAVHRDGDEVWAIFEVADDDAALLP